MPDLTGLQTHSVAGMLKGYLRELPEPVVPIELYGPLEAAMGNTTNSPPTTPHLTTFTPQPPQLITTHQHHNITPQYHDRQHLPHRNHNRTPAQFHSTAAHYITTHPSQLLHTALQ